MSEALAPRGAPAGWTRRAARSRRSTRGDSPVATASLAHALGARRAARPVGPRRRWPSPASIPTVAPPLARRARAEGVRLMLVRRPGDRLADSGRRWAYADSRPGHEQLRWSVRASDADLLDVPWDGSVGEPATGPTYLVCTHGGHDACCALRGRPLARSLPVAGPAGVWECSHLGGGRFAANVVVLPHGFYYGQVPGDGAELVDAHQHGRVALPWLRGRAGVPAPAAAAQHAARDRARAARRRRPAAGAHRGSLTARRVRGRALARSRWPARPATSSSRSRAGRPPEAGRLTCRAMHPAHPRTWQHAGRWRSSRVPRPRATSSGIASSVAVSEPW